ncbi:Thioesterase [gamma proteobacterium HdN1]|nr:Thioesterase [gamma proteobacterium HdN1]
MLFGKNKSLVCFAPNDRAVARLFCFPCAGAGASMYWRWARLMPGVEVWAVNYPGREMLHGQTFASSVEVLLEPVLMQRELFSEKPFVVYGHSFGAVAAFSCALQLQEAGIRAQAVVSSARRAPHLPAAHAISGLPDDRLLVELDRFGGLPAAIRQDPEMLALYLPVIRADLSLNEIIRIPDSSRIDSPLYVFAGTDDCSVSSTELAAWESRTRSSFEFIVMAGGHFFIHEPVEAFIAYLRNIVAISLQEPDEDVMAF